MPNPSNASLLRRFKHSPNGTEPSLEALLAERKKPLKVLEIGCGDTPAVQVVRTLDALLGAEAYTYLGVDIDHNPVSFLTRHFSKRQNINAECIDATNIAELEAHAERGSFDLVILRHPDILGQTATTRRMVEVIIPEFIQPDGILYISTFNSLEFNWFFEEDSASSLSHLTAGVPSDPVIAELLGDLDDDIKTLHSLMGSANGVRTSSSKESTFKSRFKAIYSLDDFENYRLEPNEDDIEVGTGVYADTCFWFGKVNVTQRLAAERVTSASADASAAPAPATASAGRVSESLRNTLIASDDPKQWKNHLIRRFQYQRPELRELLPKDRKIKVLEIGCSAHGRFVVTALDEYLGRDGYGYGYKYLGLDTERDSIIVAAKAVTDRRDIDFRCADATDPNSIADHKPGSFDLVILRQPDLRNRNGAATVTAMLEKFALMYIADGGVLFMSTFDHFDMDPLIPLVKKSFPDTPQTRMVVTTLAPLIDDVIITVPGVALTPDSLCIFFTVKLDERAIEAQRRFSEKAKASASASAGAKPTFGLKAGFLSQPKPAARPKPAATPKASAEPKSNFGGMKPGFLG